MTEEPADTDLLALTQELTGALRSGGKPDVPPGTRIGRYRIDRVLGRGGMGLVLLAEQTEPIRRLVALKLVARDQSDHTSRIRFQIERQVLARLAHPGIAQIFDAGTTPEGAAWFAMEFVPGQRLDAWWKSAQPTPRDGVQLFRDICRAFGHAHRAGVVHCDIKPANILIADIDGRPQPKIIDFGIARATGHIDPGDVGGTPDYVSPEQAAGRGEVDARSDVHALAATLRALLTGIRLRPWLEGCTKPSTDVFARIASADPTHATLAALEKLPLRRRRRIELATILDKALASDPTARYDDAHALADEFDRWLNDRPVVALPASTVYHASCWLRRHRALAATGLILALTIIGFSWQLTEQYHRTLAERDTAEQMVEILLDTFRAADPLQYPEGSITARELLAGATGRIARRELTSSARTRILIELGGVQQNLELYDDARISLRSALDSAHGDQLTEIEALLGRVDIDSGNFDAARTRAQASVDRHANIQSRAWIVAMLQLAEIAILVGDGAEAEARLSAVRDPAFADADAELARDWHLQTARLADDQAQVAEALLHYEGALRISAALWGEDDARTLTVLNDLAIATSHAGRHAEAIRHLERVAHHTRLTWGDSAGLAIVYGNLGTTLFRAGQYAEAEQQHLAAIAIFQSKLGEDSMHTGTEYNNLATALDAQGRPAEALEWYSRAERSLMTALGADHVRVGITMHNRARALLALGRAEEASPLIEHSGDNLKKSMGDTHPRWQIYRITRAEAALMLGEANFALAELEDAMPTLVRELGEDNRDVARGLRLLLRARAALGHCDAALSELARLRGDPADSTTRDEIVATCGRPVGAPD